MFIYPIVSSSNGNCTLVKSGKHSILVDFGISVRALETTIGKEAVSNLNAVFITHEHGDHIKGLNTFGKKYPTIPVYINELSYEANRKKMGDIYHKNLLAGEIVKIKGFKIKPITAKHDTYCCFGFLIEAKNNTLAYLTDTGCTTKLMEKELKSADILFIEADYDTEKLANFEHYDDLLKSRIRGNTGHLSTDQALDFVENIGIAKLKKVFVGHLSDRTNSPELVLNLAKSRFPDHFNKFMIAPLTEGISID